MGSTKDSFHRFCAKQQRTAYQREKRMVEECEEEVRGHQEDCSRRLLELEREVEAATESLQSIRSELNEKWGELSSIVDSASEAGQAMGELGVWVGEREVEEALANKMRQLEQALASIEEDEGHMDPMMRLLPALLTALMN